MVARRHPHRPDWTTRALVACAAAFVVAVLVGQFVRNLRARSNARDPNFVRDSILSARVAVWRLGQLDPEQFYRISEDGQHVGPSQADVILTVFSDYACGHCIAFERTLEHLERRFPDHVAVVYKHFIPLMQRGILAIHLAAECAAEQGRFNAYNRTLFAHPAFIPLRSGWIRLADSAKIPDMAKFVGCTRSERYRDRIERDNREARDIGVDGTPTTFVNGLRVVGEAPYPTLDAMIAYHLDRLR